MRDIKFRAWDKKLKKYINIETVVIDPLNGIVIETAGFDMMGNNDNAVLEQYTGLKDKNGVEIYEGDIVCQQMRFDEKNGVIFWQEEKSRFAINLDGFITTITKPQEDSYEVVGNIHENPELLEGTK